MKKCRYSIYKHTNNDNIQIQIQIKIRIKYRSKQDTIQDTNTYNQINTANAEQYLARKENASTCFCTSPSIEIALVIGTASLVL